MHRGVLLMAYGAPNSLADVEPFYTDIRRGRKPSPELLAELMGRYEAIGGKSPLLDITNRQATALAASLGDGTRVYVGMRHWTPWIREAVAAMARDGVRDAAALVLAPHYSRMSIGQYLLRLDEAVAETKTDIHFRRIESWHTHPAYIAALVARVQEARQKFPAGPSGEPHVLFTAHSLPERIREWQDPYPAQLEETGRLIATRLGLSKWGIAYQSAGRTPEPWLGPDIVTMVDQLAERGEKRVLICVIGFVADHLEVLYDIDVEARAAAGRKGLQLERIAMLNDDPGLVSALADLTRNAFRNA
ncbi:MAG: ferrochelatase [Lentisphaerae bacterium]|nr:ferrochelatase [Lentisphaerota bacterium]